MSVLGTTTVALSNVLELKFNSLPSSSLPLPQFCGKSSEKAANKHAPKDSSWLQNYIRKFSMDNHCDYENNCVKYDGLSKKTKNPLYSIAYDQNGCGTPGSAYRVPSVVFMCYGSSSPHSITIKDCEWCNTGGGGCD